MVDYDKQQSNVEIELSQLNQVAETSYGHCEALKLR